jgi:hypothetical protein
LEKFFEDARCLIHRERNIAFVGWRDAPRVEQIREWHRVGRAIAKDFPGEGACVDIVLRGKPDFDDAMRKEAERLARDPQIFERGFAHVLLIPGLAGAAVRAFINTVLIVARPPAPAKVSADVASAVAWLHPKISGWDTASLTTACDELITRLRTPV